MLPAFKPNSSSSNVFPLQVEKYESCSSYFFTFTHPCNIEMYINKVVVLWLYLFEVPVIVNMKLFTPEK